MLLSICVCVYVDVLSASLNTACNSPCFPRKPQLVLLWCRAAVKSYHRHPGACVLHCVCVCMCL